jgi:N-acetylmuramoyl-L-alanine amidase
MEKYKIYVFLLLILFISGFYYVTAKEVNTDLLGRVIYIDPGHGGLDPGAMYKDIYEKDINLSISLKLQEALGREGAIVYLTRYGDYDLSVKNAINRKRSDLFMRSKEINDSDCDMFLSIHLNSDPSNTWHGAQVFYNDKNPKNKQIAKLFQDSFKKHLNSNRKYKKDNTLYLQRKVNRPGVLLEVGFISNPNDRYKLRQNYYQDKIVNTIVMSLKEYYK